MGRVDLRIEGALVGTAVPDATGAGVTPVDFGPYAGTDVTVVGHPVRDNGVEGKPFQVTVRAAQATADFLPSSLAVGPHMHLVWDRTGSTFGAVHTDLIQKLCTTMGATLARTDVSWHAYEPTRGAFAQRPYAGKLEDSLTAIRASGAPTRMVVVLNESPEWAATYTGTKTLPDDPATYAGIGRWFHEHLAPWNDVMAGVEVFNEANLAGSGGFDQGVTTPRPEHYLRCLMAYYDAAKASTNPGLPVIFGAPESIAVDPTKDPSNAKTNFIGLVYQALRAMKDAGTVPEGYFPWDVMAVHVYPNAARFTAADDYVAHYRHLAALEARMKAEGDPAPVFITETGHSAHENVGTPPSWQTGLTEQQQADYTVEDINGVAASYPRVKGLIVYNDWAKGDPATTTAAPGLTLQATRHQYGFGTLQHSPVRGTGKPLYSALRTKLAALPNPWSPPAS